MSVDITKLSESVINQNIDHAKKLELLDQIRKLRSPEENRWNYWYVILTLAILALSVPIYAFAQLIGHGEGKFPEPLLSVASTSVGALAGFLVRQGPRGGAALPDAKAKP
jgi:hypothetical protein